MSTTDAPTTQADRYDFNRLPKATQDDIARRAVQLFDGSRTRSQCWKIAMAEYRLSQPRPYILDEHDRLQKGSVACTCGWDAVSNSPRGLITSARAHSRYHNKQRLADRALVEIDGAA
jgi:hypothetical protein